MGHYDDVREQLEERVLDKKVENWLGWPETEERIDVIGTNGNSGEHYGENNKYKKRLRNNIALDVYDVLDAWKVDNPALQHAIKKMLQAGQRGYKDFNQDIDEAIQALERAKAFPPIPF